MALISVIVPIYNVEPYLNNCKTSIFNQIFNKITQFLFYNKKHD